MSAFTADYASASVQPSPNHGERVERAASRTCSFCTTPVCRTAEGALDWLCRARARCRATISFFEDGRCRCSSCRRRGVPGMPARASGTARPTSTRCRSASRSPMPAIPAGCLATHRCRSKRSSNCVATAANAGRSRRKGCLRTPMSPQVRKVDPGENFPWDLTGTRAGVGHWVSTGADHRRAVLPEVAISRPAGRGAAVDAVALWLRH
jgi:N-acetylmuramoyl-L-alanine amidase